MTPLPGHTGLDGVHDRQPSRDCVSREHDQGTVTVRGDQHVLAVRTNRNVLSAVQTANIADAVPVYVNESQAAGYIAARKDGN